MAGSDKKQDFITLENLIKESDERHSKVMEEMKEQHARTLDELKMLIVANAAQPIGKLVPIPPQDANEVGPWCSNGGIMSSSQYTKLEFPRYDGTKLKE